MPHAGDVAARTAVVLESFPVALFRASEEHWASLLREYALRGFGHPDQPYRAEDVAAASRALGVVFAALSRRVERASGAATADRLALTVELGTVTPGDFATMQAVLEDARRLAMSGQLLVLPTLPEVAALRNWMSEQVTEQLAGGEPQPWEFAAETGGAPAAVDVQWDSAIEPAPSTAWLVGDDRNRVVAASPAASALLGWGADELVGQRLLVVIPPALRERHVAGFTRSVVMGDDRLIGVPLEVPAWTRDGREVPVTLTLTRHTAKAGRTVYLATLDPRD